MPLSEALYAFLPTSGPCVGFLELYKGWQLFFWVVGSEEGTKKRQKKPITAFKSAMVMDLAFLAVNQLGLTLLLWNYTDYGFISVWIKTGSTVYGKYPSGKFAKWWKWARHCFSLRNIVVCWHRSACFRSSWSRSRVNWRSHVTTVKIGEVSDNTQLISFPDGIVQAKSRRILWTSASQNGLASRPRTWHPPQPLRYLICIKEHPPIAVLLSGRRGTATL